MIFPQILGILCVAVFVFSVVIFWRVCVALYLHCSQCIILLNVVLGTWHWRWVWLETSAWWCVPSSIIFTPVLINDRHWLSDCICCDVHHYHCHHWRVVYRVSSLECVRYIIVQSPLRYVLFIYLHTSCSVELSWSNTIVWVKRTWF